MTRAMRALFMVWVALAMPAVIACGSTTMSSGASSSSPSFPIRESGKSSPSAASGGAQLDPEVSMPTGFPSDFPIYSGARLTSQGSFTTSGKTSWAMTWETTDSVDAVTAFFDDKLNKVPWSVGLSGTTNGTYSAVFTRKDNSSYGGILGVDGTKKSGVTTITLVLGTA